MSEALPGLSSACSDVQQGQGRAGDVLAALPLRKALGQQLLCPSGCPAVWPRGGSGEVVQLCHLHADGFASADGYSQKCLDLIPFTDFFPASAMSHILQGSLRCPFYAAVKRKKKLDSVSVAGCWETPRERGISDRRLYMALAAWQSLK